MSKLGPLPEQPTFNALVPHTDLRDAIRVENGLEPLDEKDVSRYGQPPIALFQWDEPEEVKRVRDSDGISIDIVIFLALGVVLFISKGLFLALLVLVLIVAFIVKLIRR